MLQVNLRVENKFNVNFDFTMFEFYEISVPLQQFCQSFLQIASRNSEEKMKLVFNFVMFEFFEIRIKF